jgi:2-methylcitrate dehydratase PrpD
MMQAKRRFGADDVERIVVYGSKATLEHTGWKYRPEGMTAAQLNLSYCVATLLIEGDVFVDQFSEDKVADPQRMALAAKVDVREDPKITALGSKYRHKVSLTVHLNDGTVLSETVEAPRGSEKSFASASDVEAKFVKLASRVLPRAQVDKVMGFVLDMDRLSEIGALAAALVRA